ncbi:MAG: hypothetical protein IKS05_00645 [Oscillospiraceae bacterium]|nr:hypothetical protein [Oscillospiraceae bacterium]
MKKKHSLRRALCLTLTGLLSLSVLWPGLTASAQDGLVIDDSGFSNPAISQTTVYYWHEGIPKANESNFNRKFPVLLTWNGQYYFTPNQTFVDSVQNNLTKGKDGVTHFGWSTDDDDSGYYNGSFDADGRFPHGAFLQNLGYGSGLLSEISILNFESIRQTGTTVSFTSKGLPNLIPLAKANMTEEEFQQWARVRPFTANTSEHVSRYCNTLPAYALEVDMTAEDSVPTTGGDYAASGGFRVGENYLTGIRRDYYKVTTGGLGDWDWSQANGFVYTLYPMNEYTAPLMCNEAFKESNFSLQDFQNKNYLKSVAWYAFQNGDSYRFLNRGSYFHDKNSRISHSFGDWEELEWLISTDPSVALCHVNSNFGSHGRINFDNSWLLSSAGLGSIGGIGFHDHDFICYYGEPVLMDFLQTDFSVENGQVTNLEGPIAIANDTTVTVKEGGTLTIDGWVMNNGHIVVEPGGTLYIQDGACLNRLMDGRHTGGGVLCSGLCIVGEKAKLCGGGVEGLQFLAGSHVINFGAVISENFLVEQSYTVENRGGGLVLYGPGYGVKGSGYALFAGTVSGTDYPEKGAVEPVAASVVADNAIYSN